MPLLAEGVYCDNIEDKKYEKETTYQLRYYIAAALYSVDCVLNYDDVKGSAFYNRMQYYRYYVDNLFRYQAMIHDRFCNNGARGEVKDKKLERIEANKKNYMFDENRYPLLNQKVARNIIEHIDERNIKTMMEYEGVGGFNAIIDESDKELYEELIKNRKYYPYILDVLNKRVLFYNCQSRNDEDPEFEIDIVALKMEIQMLKISVDDFWDIINILG